MYEFFTNLIKQETKEDGGRSFTFEVNINLLKTATDQIVSQQLGLIPQLIAEEIAPGILKKIYLNESFMKEIEENIKFLVAKKVLAARLED